jgi:HEAT repeat protein
MVRSASLLEECSRALTHADMSVRLAAIEILAGLEGGGADTALAAALERPFPETRLAAAQALGRRGGLPGVRALLGLLTHRDAEVRWCVTHALAMVGPLALPLLIDALRSWDCERRVQAAAVLGHLGDSRAVPPLVEALQDGYGPVSKQAAASLIKLGDPGAVGPLLTVLASRGGWRHGWGRGRAAEVLGKLGSPLATAALIEALEEGHPGLSPRAAAALGEIGDSRAVWPLCRALRNQSQELRHSAAAALGRIAQRNPVPQLRAALPLLRWGAFWSLGDPAHEYRIALEWIEWATEAWKDLPLPAGPPPPAPEALPIPAAPAPPDPHGLPCPARAPAPSSPPDAKGAAPRPPRPRRVWDRLRQRCERR